MTDSNGESPSARRMRRLRELGRGNQLERVNTAVRQVWEQPGGPRPSRIRLRRDFLLAAEAGGRAAPMPRLIASRGVALRFYLLAVFDAQCRPPSGQPWRNTRSVTGQMGWEDLIAIDVAYSRPASGYQLPTRQNRTLSSSRIRQVKAALQKLEQLGDQALVEIPRKANGTDRNYDGFLLMKESGRGGLPTPSYYTAPAPGPGVIDIPSQFFLHGWVQVLYPSEIATWLTLRYLRSRYPRSHNESGVFLYGQPRETVFHLLRDTYEDGCRSLLEYGLIRRAQPMRPAAESEPGPTDWARLFMMAGQADQNGQIRYQPNRYQLTDQGLNSSAYAKTMTSLQARR
jgi:hypothetical protein